MTTQVMDKIIIDSKER